MSRNGGDGRECFYKLLPVPLYGQQSFDWCWAAAGEMIFAYFGKLVPQCVQVCKVKGAPDCSGCGNGDSSGYPKFGLFGFKACPTPVQKALRWENLTAQINYDKPVGFSSAYCSFDYGTSGHYMVVRGYIQWGDQKMLVVNDPLPMNADKCKGGSVTLMTYDDYLDFLPEYSHDFTHYNITRIDRLDDANPLILCEDDDSHFNASDCGEEEVCTALTHAREPGDDGGKEPYEAALKAHELLKRFPLIIARELGFKSRDELVNSRLIDMNKGQGIKIFLPRLKSLFNLIRGGGPNEDPANDFQRVFPVCGKSDGIISAIVVRLRRGRWTHAIYGGEKKYFGIPPRLPDITVEQEYSILEVSTLKQVYWGSGHIDKELNMQSILTPIHEYPGLEEFSVFKEVEAKKILTSLKKNLDLK